MNRVRAVLFIAVIFCGGWALGYAQRASVSGAADRLEHLPEVPAVPAPSHGVDHLRLTQANAVTDLAPIPGFSAETLSDPRVRATLEKNLREVPYAVLKQVYLERQDEQWEKQQSRYAQPKEMNEEEIDRRAAGLFESFKRNAGENSYFVSRGDWKLRGGRTVPYIVLVEYYASRAEKDRSNGFAQPDQAPGASATSGKELCYVSTLYLRIGEKYAADGQSSCVSWVPMRGEHPFAVHSNYNSKRLVPYFDSFSVALPGFGGDAASEWYDAAANRWTPVGRVRFDPVSKEEFTSLSRDTQIDSSGE